jgi:molecular chaperone GrpE
MADSARQPEQQRTPEREGIDPVVAGEASLKDQLDAARQERDANFDRFLRTQAEFDTARRRWAKELEEERRFRALPLVKDLLPALDNLHRAVDAAQKTSSADSLKAGVELVLKQIDDVLAQHGVKPIAALHESFDPNIHEAISQMPGQGRPAMSVLHEAERGYTMHDRVVRPSKVVVAAPEA